ncbi:SPFH domain-containing protein [Saccharospirillum salsuginis]|uniref:Band 7 domain-containing protein n=1 Tax=Saccharospirillum salsuginis TaxID=418750 RepID=A0A918N6T3_9GAMM|nr:SPFH domain-containing protein [Saccharospirillum salsuginis]GGX47759.1 hypothetical protein GCM10007392_13280 [Saccharospirillum salsuginis]
MIWMIVAAIALVLAFVIPAKLPEQHKVFKAPLQVGLVIVAVFVVAQTSFVHISQDSIGHLKKIYGFKDLPTGQIIARDGEKGPQADVLGPGFHIIPLIKIQYQVEELPVPEVPDGQMGILTARDGQPLRSGQFLARGWGQENINEMLDAKTFLTGNGQKGTQLTVLPPGKYRFNRYLFELDTVPAVEVDTGEVAVIKSNVQTLEDGDCPQVIPDLETNDDLSTPVVPKGCIGVWDEPYMPGNYYLNPRAYKATIIQTRAQSWTYQGGYQTRKIDLTVAEDGGIQQRATTIDVSKPNDAADRAIITNVEGWRVPIELRLLVEVSPKDAPRVVASVGDLNAVENKIATPSVRSVLRNVTGQEGRKVLQLIEQREEMENYTEQALSPELAKAGVTLKEVRMADPVIPPELLVARQREQLAGQLETTFQQEKLAQQERIEVERQKATADQQSTLVKAEIEKEAAKQRKETLALEGEGEKLKLIEIAKGEQARAEVLGARNAAQLAMLKEVLAAAMENPDIIKVPTVNVSSGSEGSLEGAAAVLGASNLVNMLRDGQNTANP